MSAGGSLNVILCNFAPPKPGVPQFFATFFPGPVLSFTRIFFASPHIFNDLKKLLFYGTATAKNILKV